MHMLQYPWRQSQGQGPRGWVDRSPLEAGCRTWWVGTLSVLCVGAIGFATPLLAAPPITPELVYSVSGCEDTLRPAGESLRAAAPDTLCKGNGSPDRLGFVGGEPVRNITVGAEGRKLAFSHDLTYTCCASIVLDRAIDQTGRTPTITIVERDLGDHCRCLCDYQVSGAIGPLPPGPYVLRVYGEFNGDGSRVLLFERSVNLSPGATTPQPSVTGTPQLDR